MPSNTCGWLMVVSTPLIDRQRSLKCWSSSSRASIGHTCCYNPTHFSCGWHMVADWAWGLCCFESEDYRRRNRLHDWTGCQHFSLHVAFPLHLCLTYVFFQTKRCVAQIFLWTQSVYAPVAGLQVQSFPGAWEKPDYYTKKTYMQCAVFRLFCSVVLSFLLSSSGQILDSSCWFMRLCFIV